MKTFSLVVAGALLLLTAGCSSHDVTDPSAGSARPSSSSASGPATTGSSASATPTPTSSPSASSAPTCTTADLRVSVRPDPNGAAAGSTFDDVLLRNTGATTCLMTGWPGVSFVTGSQGRQVGAPAARQGTPAVVSLAPGASAEALLQVAEAGNFAPCTTTSVRGLRVYPPNQRDAVFVPLPTKACAQTSAQQLTVRPVVRRG
ncbi:DUF4232 domain-containing protein [Aeromicrobium sp. CnD17-E]|uniref:DUF4232 domain-containing protein n=1 Tax=Aeromicrobium sp. CnD17-E TaxID=2954487 RepID=UPI0020968424|nr:DUF4232 domain-containing protein [Aeromicrobium sp. CnD17-E]MCO7239929.1 DUF4232 domain-containing protein [Aeromicrobium sp. CnD17-E]